MRTHTIRYGCSSLPANYTILNMGKAVEPVGGVITYRILNSTNDIPDEYSNKVIHTAMEIIQNGFDQIEPKGRRIHLKEVYDDSAQIVHAFTKRNHSNQCIQDVSIRCPFPFDGKGGVLAHAFPPGSGSLSSQIHYDDSEVYVVEWDRKNIHLLTVVVHETLHALNVGHSSVRDSIMYPSYTGPKTELHKDDLMALSHVYSDLKSSIKLSPSNIEQYANDHMVKAMLKYEGLHESSPVIDGIIQKYFSWATGTTISWCGIGLKNIADEASCESPEGFELARNWLSVGTPTNEPELGDIAVLWRESKKSWKGHVGIFVRKEGKYLRIFGGNQKDSYSFQWYHQNRLLGYRKLRKL